MRWRTRMWILQATQGHLNSLKKHKNQYYWFIDNYEITEFKSQFNRKTSMTEDESKIIEIKTDNMSLFEYSLISFNLNGYKINEISLDLHNSDKLDNIMSEYERKFSTNNNPIYYTKVVK